MKKFIAVALFLAAIVAVAGCSKSTDKKESAEATTEDYLEEAEDINPVELEAAEYVKLGDYKGLTITAEKQKVTDEDVEESIEDTIEAYAEPVEIKGRDVVEKGDYVNLDYTTYIDGKKNEDYTDTDVDVKAEDGEMDAWIGYGLGDDFKLEEKVIGSKIDDTVTVEFTYPEDYDDESVAGKKAKMEVVIRGIFEEKVPTLEEYLKQYEDGKSEKEYKKEVRADLEETAQYYAEANAMDQLWKQIVDNATQVKEFTDDMLAQEKENVLIVMAEEAMYNDMEVDEFIKERYGMTVDEYAKYSLKGQCVGDLLVDKEKITLSDEEYNQGLKEIAEENELESVDEVTDYYSKDDIRDSLLEDKLYDKLKEYNTIKYKEVIMNDDDDAETVD